MSMHLNPDIGIENFDCLKIDISNAIALTYISIF